jgi:hypothetical protein
VSRLDFLRRELSELRLASRIAAGFGLSGNATILPERAALIEAEIASTTEGTAPVAGRGA